MRVGAAAGLFNLSFVCYGVGVVFVALADATVFITLPFVVLSLSSERAALATALALVSLPSFAAPLIGLVADRVRLRLPLRASTLLRALLMATLAFLAQRGLLGLELVYLVALLHGSLAVFAYAATTVIVPHLVPLGQLARANSLLSGAVMGMNLVGYGLAGALVASFGVVAALALAVPCFAVLAVTLRWVALPAAEPGRRALGVVADLRAGAAFVARHVRLRSLLVLVLLLYGAVGGLGVLMPIAMQTLGRGAAGYGLFSALLAGGALVGMVSVSAAARLRASRLVVWGAGVVAVGFGILATGGFVAALTGALVAGFGLGVLEVAGLTLVQRLVPHGLRGKVIGLVLALNGLSLSGGAALAGVAAGLPAWGFYAAASALLALFLAWWAALGSRLEQPDGLGDEGV